jgi:hypothetical protein
MRRRQGNVKRYRGKNQLTRIKWYSATATAALGTLDAELAGKRYDFIDLGSFANQQNHQ